MRAAAALFLAQAALSSAFVVPKLADFSPEDIDVELSLSRVVRIPCTGCPVEEDSDLVLFAALKATPKHSTNMVLDL